MAYPRVAEIGKCEYSYGMSPMGGEEKLLARENSSATINLGCSPGTPIAVY